MRGDESRAWLIIATGGDPVRGCLLADAYADHQREAGAAHSEDDGVDVHAAITQSITAASTIHSVSDGNSTPWA